MRRVLLARITELVELKTFLKLFLVLMRVVVHAFAHGAFKVNEVVLRHRIDYDEAY